MQRYMELIYKILEHAEQKASGKWSLLPEFPGYTCEQVHYHAKLCDEAGYLTVQKISSLEEPFARYKVGSLTWTGHEALAQYRNDR